MTEFEMGKDGEMDDLRVGRSPLKTHRPDWKGKLRKNCLERVQADRARLLWKMRKNSSTAEDQKEIMDSEFRNIVSDEMKKIQLSSSNDPSAFSKNNVDDTLWEDDGPNQAHEFKESNFGIFSEDLLIEMDKVFHEELKAEAIQRELEVLERVYEEEDTYLAQAVYEQLKLNNEKAEGKDTFWCPICKRGELKQNNLSISCSCCKLLLDIQIDKYLLKLHSTSSWDGTITLANFNTSASMLLERWNEINPTLPPWIWIPCSILPCGASRKDEGYLVLENIHQFMLNEDDGGEERKCSEEVKLHNTPLENCDGKRFCDEDNCLDSDMLVESSDREICIFDFHIVYRCSYRVPVLYFSAYRSGGQPLGLADIETSLPPHSLKILQEARWTYMTLEEHPHLNRPFFMLHPCGTSDWMKLLFDGNLFPNDLIAKEYLISWLSVVGQAVGLKISSGMLKWPK